MLRKAAVFLSSGLAQVGVGGESAVRRSECFACGVLRHEVATQRGVVESKPWRGGEAYERSGSVFTDGAARRTQEHRVAVERHAGARSSQTGRYMSSRYSARYRNPMRVTTNARLSDFGPIARGLRKEAGRLVDSLTP
jgi:hypothetical protein